MDEDQQRDEEVTQETDVPATTDEEVSETTAPAIDETSELREQLLRVRADFDNYKRRTEEERPAIAQTNKLSVIQDLLPVFDTFDRAFKEDVTEEIKKSNWYQGVNAIRQQFLATLNELDIDRIETVGKEFDPELHEAISHEESKEYSENLISEEYEAGYKLHSNDYVIRHAKVKVSSGKAKK